MRFNVFKAHHDNNVKGLNLSQKFEIINILKKKGKIFITTEGKIEPELQEYQIKISPEKIHSVLYYAWMYIGDSQTMTTEAALLGTPAIKCNTLANELSVPNEIEEKYDLCYSYKPYQFIQLMDKIKDLVDKPDLKQIWSKKKKKLLQEKIDLSNFLCWFIEEYPESQKMTLIKEKFI